MTVKEAAPQMTPEIFGYATTGTVNHYATKIVAKVSLCLTTLVLTQRTRRFPSSHDCATCRRKLKARTKRNGRTAA